MVYHPSFIRIPHDSLDVFVFDWWPKVLFARENSNYLYKRKLQACLVETIGPVCPTACDICRHVVGIVQRCPFWLLGFVVQSANPPCSGIFPRRHVIVVCLGGKLMLDGPLGSRRHITIHLDGAFGAFPVLAWWLHSGWGSCPEPLEFPVAPRWPCLSVFLPDLQHVLRKAKLSKSLVHRQ